jgi:hypothetical protein
LTVDHPATSTSTIDVLDRVLDKGIVIDAWARVSLVGIDLLTIEGRIVVSSIQTHLTHPGRLPDLARSRIELRAPRHSLTTERIW